MPTLTAPASLYHDPAVWESERRGVFARAWQFLGLQADLARPGDYLADVFAGYPLLAIVGEDGVLRAFHNVCRHRAGPLVSDAKGRCEGALTCRYHGWRYALDGRLRSAVAFGSAEGFDPRDFGLFPARVETWRGFVFVNPDPDAGPLAEALGPLDALFGNRPIPASPLRRSHEIGCNWKVYVENYLEGYHIDLVHPALAAEVDAAAYAVRMEGPVAIHEVPATAGAAEGLWAWMWPNLAFNLYKGVVMVEHMRPMGHARTRLDYLYLHEAGDPQIDAALVTTERLTREDAWICERVQQNLDAGVYDRGVLSPRHEGAVAWFQARVAEAIA
ncbi:MAG TPA: aromatic ring-hydroxylating dioxygenase subunit alpha [Caulobacteraceae bacterium]|nr:aromatic ring-hydroxylating dioxygenase subunit alpha [Caulobacteraceae bacterium]